MYRLCKFDRSLNFFNESLIQNPNDGEILVNKDSALEKLSYFSDAMIYYDHALMVDSDFLPAKNNKANAFANLGNSKDTILVYDEVLEENPNYLTARKNLEILLSLNLDINKTDSLSNVEDTYDPESSFSENVVILDLENKIQVIFLMK